jgi:homoserine dehydrogenase
MRTIPVILLGIGGVGAALVRQIVANRQFHANTYGLTLAVVALCDSNGAVLENAGLTDAQLTDLLAYKAGGSKLADHELGGKQNNAAAIVDMAGREGAIVVDCSASEATVPALLTALDRGYQIAMANKKPLTVEYAIYQRIVRGGAVLNKRNPDAAPLVHQPGRSRWETTVGAGLPVIATLNRLVASGDPVTRIAGTFSGTLGYVMTGLQAGKAFSEIVREAHQLGYTEPDPRDDLGGVDVARKALILARGIGWQLEMSDVAISGLYPATMADLSVTEFMSALPELDAEFAAQVAAAKADGKVLRYAATVADGRCEVGPVVVEAGSPLGRLSGTDNLVEFHTGWYSPNPLVIQGRGAGTDVTAAGVLSDVIELAYAQ